MDKVVHDGNINEILELRSTYKITTETKATNKRKMRNQSRLPPLIQITKEVPSFFINSRALAAS